MMDIEVKEADSLNTLLPRMPVDVHGVSGTDGEVAE